ncbi:TetR/AcrR family transcriptional regulator [Micromonospora sp. NPDC006431]|uniref:TetR/AcrR family transcriptional regulator n=1 Tax=Micromonospora sp. NPDC006431 TaxID=3364235 RepID=UPI0036750B22
MLDACGVLLDEVGYEKLSTTAIAERAGVAVGSVYQFFPDKRAIVQALMLRGLDAYLQRLRQRFAAGELGSWSAGVGSGIDEYITMHRCEPGFHSLHLDEALNETGEDIDITLIISDELAEALVEQFAIPDSSDLRFSLRIAVTVADALINRAFHRHPGGDEKLLTETRRLTSEYLHSRLDLEPLS